MIKKYYGDLIIGDIIFESWLCCRVKMILKNKLSHSIDGGTRVYYITTFDFESAKIEEFEAFHYQHVTSLK